jgi:uncharacterized protein DUF4136
MKAVFARPLLLSLAVALSACTATGYPTEVTRFHAGQQIARGTVAIEPFDAPGGGPGARGPEFDFYAGAVAQQLARLGWTVTRAPGQADHVALIGISEDRYTRRESSPVSIGVGGGTGGWHSGVGGGVGFNLGGGPHQLVTATLNVRIKQRADDKVFWEGRATATARADRPEGSPAVLAPHLAEALFQGFPGESGRTIRLP